MKSLVLILLLAQVAGAANTPQLFEMVCSVYRGGAVAVDEKLMDYDGLQDITLRMHADYLDQLQNGFCIFGPVDYEARITQLKERLAEEGISSSDLDELQGVPK